MGYKEIINKIRPELDKVIGFLDRELAKIRTGRASISLVEDIIADCFDKTLPLKQLGAITLSGPRQILISRITRPGLVDEIRFRSKLIKTLNLIQRINFLISTTNINRRLALEILMLEL